MAWSEVPFARGSYRFRTTSWSQVAQAATVDAAGKRALEELCTQYWPPLYAFARWRGRDVEDARDETQTFFVELLSNPTLERADANRGRFRTYLLTCFSRHLARSAEARSARKRGGDVRILSIDTDAAELEMAAELAVGATPESVFDRRWAITVIESALARLGQEYAARGRRDRFDALRSYLQDQPDAATYRETAAALGTSEGAVKVAVHRLRRRLAELLLEEVGPTLGDDVDPRDELAELLTAVRGADSRTGT